VSARLALGTSADGQARGRRSQRPAKICVSFGLTHQVLSMTRSRMPRLAAGFLLTLGMSGPVFAQAPPYAECGDLIQGVTGNCVLFADSQGREWLLNDYGSFVVGNHVLVTGIPDMFCITICQQGDGCIQQNTIASCQSDPTTSFCECATGAPCTNPDTDGAGCENGTGTGGLLTGSGSASVTLDNLILTASQLPPNEPGLFYMGPSQINSIPFGDGQRCVGAAGGAIFRFPIRNSGTFGNVAEGPIVDLASTIFPPGGEIDAGESWHFQYWYRDPAGPCQSSFNLTNAVSVDFVM